MFELLFNSIHECDMHCETACSCGNVRSCMQVQHALIIASLFDLCLVQKDVVGLWKAAADEERHDDLFGPF
jgi:hypothetical protein